MTRKGEKPEEPNILAGGGSTGKVEGGSATQHDSSEVDAETLREYHQACAIYHANFAGAIAQVVEYMRGLVAGGLNIIDQAKVYGFLRSKDFTSGRGEEFKVNNNYGAVYVRLIARDFPDLAPHLHFKKSKFDCFFD